MNRTFTLILSLFMTVSLAACGVPAEQSNAPDVTNNKIITDGVGRQVEIPRTVESIICLGSGAPRLAAYLDAMDMLAGAEEYDTEDNVRRDYNPVYHDYFAGMPLVGSGGGSGLNNGYPEEIITASPDVILAGFDAEAADELQAQTGIPVVSVRHSTGLAHESFYKAMRVFADVIGAEERCEMILDYMDEMLEDLDTRTSNVADSEKLLAYAGAVTWNGQRGFAGTYSDFSIFSAINALNAAKNDSIEGFYEADLEAVLLWNPDVIFLDPGNMHLVNEEYNTNPKYFKSLKAVQEGQVYSMPAFNFAGTNITYAFMDAYYAGTVLYPKQFADVDIAEKSEEILTAFLGVNTYDIMAEAGLYYGKITIGE